VNRTLSLLGLAATLLASSAQAQTESPTPAAAAPLASTNTPALSTNTPPVLSPEEVRKQKEKELLDLFQKEGNITNSLGLVMIQAPGGYRVAQYETTQSHFETVLGRNPSKFPGALHPVEKVSPDDAREFCRKLTEREHEAGTLPKSFAYSLPSESEFDDYCKDTPLETAYVSLLGDRSSTIDVGSLPANALGLHDVRGNVWEWCDNNVARGGSYQSHEDYLNPAFRFAGSATSTVEDIGFRVVLREVGGH
jgi:formylglycine-generating enzyme required for sulfatase activity